VHRTTDLGLDLLQAVGDGLDRNCQPFVYDGGEVQPGASSPNSMPGKELEDGGQTTRGSSTRSRQRASGRPWSSDRPATEASSASPVLSSGSEVERGLEEIAGVAEAYPQVKFRSTPGINWSLISIKPIVNLPERSLLVTACPDDRQRRVVSWAWWHPGVWIGPRHTNYPDGSICSFEEADETWKRGRSLVTLLDLTVVWVVRQMFLRRFGRWPGRQSLHTSYERLREQRPGELCGCDTGLSYTACCREKDLQVSSTRQALEFRARFGVEPIRRVPDTVAGWLFASGAAPTPDDVAPRRSIRIAA
jgi:hypothetical protein